MRCAFILATILIGCAGCGRKASGRRADRVTFKSFTLAVPAGWNQSTEAGVLRTLDDLDAAGLDATMTGLIAQHFPLDVDTRGAVRLYVWEVSE